MRSVKLFRLFRLVLSVRLVLLVLLGLLFASLLAGCSNAPANPLVEGLSAAHEDQLKSLSLAAIEAIENFTPENFEQLQRTHFETMTNEMRPLALEHLPTRVKNIAAIAMSQTLQLDRDSVEVVWRQLGPEKVTANVKVIGERSYQTRDASKSVTTSYSLPWVITVENGQLVHRHQGIRTKSL